MVTAPLVFEDCKLQGLWGKEGGGIAIKINYQFQMKHST